MTNDKLVVFSACEEITIVGFERECDCSHCGRPLKVGVKLAGFPGAFGADCLAKSVNKQVVGPYVQRLASASIKERAIIAGKNVEQRYGWRAGDANFKLVLKVALYSV